MEDLTIRVLKLEDIQQVLEIEAEIMNPENPTIFDIDLEATAKWLIPSGDSLCAEKDDTIIGFIFGHIRSSEFGLKEKVGWISSIGVRPDFQGSGAGSKLGKDLIDQFKKKGVTKVRTMVRWDHGDLVTYFSKTLGFSKGEMIVIERKL